MRLIDALEAYPNLSVSIPSIAGTYTLPQPRSPRKKLNCNIHPKKRGNKKTPWFKLELRADIDRCIDALPGKASTLFHLLYREQLPRDKVMHQLSITQLSVFQACHDIHYEAMAIKLGDYFGEWYTKQ